MLETHPFGNFVPPNARYLILGIRDTPYYDPAYDWFYGIRGNQFWPLLEEVYATELKDRLSKQALFASLGIAIADII